jgi:NTP pyrophosphatase (non-canonical NTP hydrolase)
MMLKIHFPSSQIGAEKYGGFLLDNRIFIRRFDFSEPIEKTLIQVNKFLEENGFDTITREDFDPDTNEYNNFPVSVVPDAYEAYLNLWVEKSMVNESNYEFITKELKDFRDERDWAQFHNEKDLAVALNIEAGELLESFLWKKPEEADKEKVKEELADVFAYAFLLADKYDFNIEQIVLEKIKQNAEKYPVDKAKGSAKKYNEL